MVPYLPPELASYTQAAHAAVIYLVLRYKRDRQGAYHLSLNK